jgi:hypothetical protein
MVWLYIDIPLYSVIILLTHARLLNNYKNRIGLRFRNWQFKEIQVILYIEIIYIWNPHLNSNLQLREFFSFFSRFFLSFFCEFEGFIYEWIWKQYKFIKLFLTVEKKITYKRKKKETIKEGICTLTCL